MQESAFQRSNAAEQGSAAFRLQLPELDLGTQIFDLDRDAQAVQASCLTEGRIDIVHQLVDDFRDIVPAHKPAVARKAALNLNIIFPSVKTSDFVVSSG